jgi:curli biogenesis system outer membrane secretion channel CsgG
MLPPFFVAGGCFVNLRSLFLFVVAAGIPVAAQSQNAAATQTAPVAISAPIPASPAKVLKLKIAIGRFSNETRYGQSLLRDSDLDPLGKQASDILSAYLARTGKLLVFERPDIVKIEREQNLEGSNNIIGVDTLIIGSIVEFGRTEDGARGFLNKARVQKAQAKVAIRLVDVRTGLVFHTATGRGEATTSTSTVLGMGSTSQFDGTLNDKALSLAVEDMLEDLVNTLAARPWRTDILAVEGGQIFISGGAAQGLRIGDRLKVMKAGRAVHSAQSGFNIALPSTEIASLQVISQFGDSEISQGSTTQLVSGSIAGIPIGDLYVVAQ